LSKASAKKKILACRKCKRICFDKPCPEHGDRDLSPDWYGFMVFDNLEHSTISKIAVNPREGIYALKVR
jgi:RNA polymerase subunit RPABC4/transcription elongation factor Spt4